MVNAHLLNKRFVSNRFFSLLTICLLEASTFGLYCFNAPELLNRGGACTPVLFKAWSWQGRRKRCVLFMYSVCIICIPDKTKWSICLVCMPSSQLLSELIIDSQGEESYWCNAHCCLDDSVEDWCSMALSCSPGGGWETGGENETERECERVSVIEILTFTNVVSINVLQRRMPWMLFQNTCRKAILKNIRSVNVMFFVFFTLAQYIHQPWFIYIKSSFSAAEFKIRIQ